MGEGDIPIADVRLGEYLANLEGRTVQQHRPAARQTLEPVDDLIGGLFAVAGVQHGRRQGDGLPFQWACRVAAARGRRGVG